MSRAVGGSHDHRGVWPIVDPMLTRVVGTVVLAVAGGVVATVGTGAHRSFGWWGVSLALLLVALAGVFAKVWQSWLGYIAYAVGWLALIYVYAVPTDGSVLIAEEPRGRMWVFGGAVVLAIVAAIPTFVWVGRRGEA